MKKLSQMNGDEGLNALARIAPEIGKIMDDEEMIPIFRGKKPDEQSFNEYGVKRVVTAVPLIAAKHRVSLYEILSALTGKTVDEIASQNILQTIKECKELFDDEDLVSFFTQ